MPSLLKIRFQARKTAHDQWLDTADNVRSLLTAFSVPLGGVNEGWTKTHSHLSALFVNSPSYIYLHFKVVDFQLFSLTSRAWPNQLSNSPNNNLLRVFPEKLNDLNRHLPKWFCALQCIVERGVENENQFATVFTYFHHPQAPPPT